MDHAQLDRFAERIRQLPDRSVYKREELVTPDFRLAEDGPLQIYYAPFDSINSRARIALIGITPGWTQMEIGIRVAHNQLRSGKSESEAWYTAKQQASFAGSMRRNLVSMLDRLDLPALLKLESSEQLFSSAQALLHTTSAFRYPVFNNGANYTGGLPPPERSAMLMQMARNVLAAELARVSEAVLVPLGRSVDAVLEMLEMEGLLEGGRRLVGFPHPSGANGHRARHLSEREAELRTILRQVLQPTLSTSQ